MGWLGKKTRNDGLTAVVTTDDTASIVTVSRSRGAEPVIVFRRSSPMTQGNPGASLKQLLNHGPAARYSASTLLDRSDYQLLLVEAPDVRPDELRAAVRWRIKDLIGFHIDDAVIDVFEIPDQRHLNRNRMMYAIAARSRRVSERAALLEGAGLEVDVVDIPEMAVRNIATLIPEESRGLALVHMNERGGIVTVSRDGVLYLTRRFETGTRELVSAEPDERDALCEGILLEIQRSLDYYESHFPHGPVVALALTPTSATTPLGEYLPQQLDIPLLTPRIEDLVKFAEPPAEPLDGDEILAIGAALRQEARAL